ncbi:probable RNA-directed DNA polymerase from transposon X-element [Trichonephila clavata]|uniref:Probable RNA-directed DNA polymerase from transposon X-element n=1 Tax=Trichonephila clavata TaxID=2740835 RepID=A0A8X6LBK1_TRICU|nr:probable RNA-directed DNA polymerase from transposon X-element [Trichonephila clavata]
MGISIHAADEPTRFDAYGVNTTLDIALAKGLPPMTTTSISELTNDHNPVNFDISLNNFTSPPLSTFLFPNPIAWTTKVKYLGLTLDHNLRYKSHLQELKANYEKKYFTLINIIGKRSKLSLQNKILIYKVYLRPALLYGCQLWAIMARDKLLQIQRLQNMSIRGIAGIPRFITVSVIHEELKIEPVTSYISKLHQNFNCTIGTHSNPTINSQDRFRHHPSTSHRFPLKATFPHLAIS